MFQWNAGGWFGGQFGCTAWLLPASALTAPRSPIVGLVGLGCFVAANALGVAIWRRRDRIAPYPAYQALLLTCCVFGVAFLTVLHLLSPGLDIEGLGGAHMEDDPRMIPVLIGITAALSGWFHAMEHAARRQRQRSQPRDAADTPGAGQDQFPGK